MYCKSHDAIERIQALLVKHPVSSMTFLNQYHHTDYPVSHEMALYYSEYKQTLKLLKGTIGVHYDSAISFKI